MALGSTAYVATVGDEMYALGTATGSVVWEKSAGTAVPETTRGQVCGEPLGNAPGAGSAPAVRLINE